MKEFLKDKIFIFIIGLLVGAIIATVSCFFYSKAHTKNINHGDRPAMMQQDGNFKGKHNGKERGKQPNNPNGSSNQSGNQGQPPSMPDQNTQTQTQTTNGNS